MSVVLDFDGSIEKLTAKIRETKRGLEGVAEGYENINSASRRAVTTSARGQEDVAKSTKKADTELKKQVSLVDKLEQHLKRLEIGQKKATNVKDLKAYNTQIASTRAALKAAGASGAAGLGVVNAAALSSMAIFKALKAQIASTFLPLAAAGAALSAVTGIVTLVTEYEQTGADLQAITGANADTLEYLKQQAVEVGVTTTVSANDTLEAYKLIASAKPELLSNAKGLAEITREAVALNEAFGGDLPTTATNLTDIMNKFKAPASDASRFVNALAAGSKEGSADISSLASSFLVAGTEITSANVKFEEGVGVFEALAEQGVKFSESGTAVRNVLSKLSATDVLPAEATKRLKAAGVDMSALSDQSLSFTDRLRALAPIQNDANALVSVFGLENKSAAQILLSQTDRIDELTEAVTETNVAYEQAAIRTSTAAGEWEKLKNTIQSSIIEQGNGLGKFLAVIIRFIRTGVLFLRDTINDLRPTFAAFGSAIGGLIRTFANLLPVQEKVTGQTSLWGKVIKVLNVPIKLLFDALTFGIKVISSLIQGFANLVKSSPVLSKFFNSLRAVISGAFGIFLDLPAYMAGARAAIATFVSESIKSIGRLGRNILNVLGEAFNFKKLFSSGFGGLKKALDDLFTNPFKGVGSKAADAFKAEFDKTKEQLSVDVEVKTKVVEGDLPGLGDDPVAPPAPTGGGFSKQEEEAKKKAEKEAKERVRLENEKSKAIIEAMKEGVDKQLALEELRFSDLIEKLKKHNIDTEEVTRQHEQNKFAIRQKFIEDLADSDGISGEERVSFIYEQTTKEIDTLELALKEASGGTLVEEQIRQINGLRQRANAEYLKSLEAFYSEDAKKAQEHEIAKLELERGSFNSKAAFEEFKQRKILDIKLKYAEQQLALIEKISGAESTAALALKKTINELKGSIAKVDWADVDFNIYALFGLDPDDPKGSKIIEGIETAVATTIDIIQQVNKIRIEDAQEAIDASDEEIEAIDEKIEAKEEELEKELGLQEEGAANNAAAVQAEIDLLKKQKADENVEREKALAQKKKVQKEQAVIDTITQSVSLITAAAQVFNSVAAIPFVGPVIGAALVAAMIGSFVAAKSRVFSSIQTAKAERGMTGVVEGKGHQNGGERFGDHIEVESKEAFGILSRTATSRYGPQFANFVNAANKGDRKGMAKVLQSLTSTEDKKSSFSSSLESVLMTVAGTQTTAHALSYFVSSKEKQKELLDVLSYFNVKNSDTKSVLNSVILSEKYFTEREGFSELQAVLSKQVLKEHDVAKIRRFTDTQSALSITDFFKSDMNTAVLTYAVEMFSRSQAVSSKDAERVRLNRIKDTEHRLLSLANSAKDRELFNFNRFDSFSNHQKTKGFSKLADFQVNRGLAQKLEAKEKETAATKIELAATLKADEVKETNRLLKSILDKESKNSRNTVDYVDGKTIVRKGNVTRIIHPYVES